MTDETRQIISDYLASCRTGEARFKEAAQRITLMTFLSAPEAQWEVILEAVRQAVDDNDLGHIAAGPIEGLLGRHGAGWVDEVEMEARRDPKFARAMTGVLKYTMTDDVWERVQAIQALVPRERWLRAGEAP